jgi:hypothetical protein
VTEWVDTAPLVSVRQERYQRLLGYPGGHVLEGRGLELSEWAREWYAHNGHPWIYARGVEPEEIERLPGALSRPAMYGMVLAAVGAGAELEQEALRLWRDERPDEYFFLEVYGTAVVQCLMAEAGAKIREWAESAGLAVLTQRSPGFSGWNIAEQPRLLALIGDRLPAPLEALDSGALRPKKSQLAVFGLAHRAQKQEAS